MNGWQGAYQASCEAWLTACEFSLARSVRRRQRARRRAWVLFVAGWAAALAVSGSIAAVWS